MTGTITIERGRIVVQFPYDERLVATAARIAKENGLRKAFDPETKCWRFPAGCAISVYQAFPEFQAGREFGEMLATQFDDLAEAEHERERYRDQVEARLTGLSVEMKSGRKLYEHQSFGVQWLCRTRFGILADDMGIGKTMQSLVAAKIIRESTGSATVVICPANKVQDWKDEADDVGVKPFVHSWAKIPESVPAPYVLIADEAHYAQSVKSKRTQAMLDLAEGSLAAFMLTGTPMKNGRPCNLYPLLKAIRHPLAVNKSEYERQYCAAQRTRFTAWDVTGCSNLTELHDRTKNTILRRMKKDCLDLPPKTRVMLQAEITPEAKAEFHSLYRRKQEEYRQNIADKYGAELARYMSIEAISLLTAMRLAASGMKVPTTIEAAQEAIEEGSQVLVFTEFRESAETIARALGVQPFVGGLAEGARQEIIQRFKAGQSKAFVATSAAGGAGLNLAEANVVIMHDRPLTPGDVDQAEDRCYRIGTKWPVTSVWVQGCEVCRKIDELLTKKDQAIKVGIEGVAIVGTITRPTLSPKEILANLFQ
jgi:SNF2 family DNA or RNA helicase